MKLYFIVISDRHIPISRLAARESGGVRSLQRDSRVKGYFYSTELESFCSTAAGRAGSEEEPEMRERSP